MSSTAPQNQAPRSTLTIWLVADEKPGHVAQARGLLLAIERCLQGRVRIDAHTVPVTSARNLRIWRELLTQRTSLGHDLPDPDLILGAGHATHTAMLAIRRARGGRTLVLMRPSLPLRWFDLAIIPAHDRPPPRANVIVTRGALNPIQPSTSQDASRGLILLGGPSKHAQWSDDEIASQIREITAASPDVDWQLTTSRRTPAATADVMQNLGIANLHITHGSETPPGWVAQQLQYSRQVWVSADSVSMIYEALTSGALVGILQVRQRARNRVGAGLTDLQHEGFITTFAQWTERRQLMPAPQPLFEAQRCAELIVHQWLGVWGLPAHKPPLTRQVDDAESR